MKSLGYKEKPKYEALACILKAGLKAIHAKDDGKLEFTPPAGPKSPAKVHVHTYMYVRFTRQATTSFTFGRLPYACSAKDRKPSKIFS